MTNQTTRPEIAELVDLVQTRLGTTRAAAEEYVHRTILGDHQPSETSAAGPVQNALTAFRAMPALVPAPTPVNAALVRLWSILPDLEWITMSVERGETMPTPDEIQAILGFGERMKAVAKAVGLEFEAAK